MPVTPLSNLQVMLPQTTEVGHMQTNMQQQVNIAQDAGNEKLQKNAEEKLLEVNGRDDVDNPKIKGDEKRQRQRQKKQRQKEKATAALEEEETPQKLMDAIRGHNIDISL